MEGTRKDNDYFYSKTQGLPETCISRIGSEMVYLLEMDGIFLPLYCYSTFKGLACLLYHFISHMMNIPSLYQFICI